MFLKLLRIKKILLLGGSYGQFPAFAEAKKRGYSIILCDYLTDNPGQHLADLYIPASTTDIQAILQIAKEHNIDAILGYASDPATYTTAVVSEALALPGNPPYAIECLTHKGKFRTAQQKAGIPVPEFRLFSPQDIQTGWQPDLPFPYVVKPVDSSDTKGVFYIEKEADFYEKASEAARFTRCDTLIAESFISPDTCNLHGDGFVVDGKLAFTALGKVMYYSEVSNLKPTATWYPGDIEPLWTPETERQINLLLEAVGFREGPVNIEARVDGSGTLFLMEIGPRSGGGMTPQTIAHAYGFDMVAATFDLLERKDIVVTSHAPKHTLLMTMHVNQSGRISGITENKDLAPYLVESFLPVQAGDAVKSYDQPGSSLGSYIYQFPDDNLLRVEREALYHQIINQIEVKEVP